jgi:hypothetical protein
LMFGLLVVLRIDGSGLGFPAKTVCSWKMII